MSELRPADAAGTAVERLLPRVLWPYAQLARLDRPVGWQLLLIPCLFGEALASITAGQDPSISRCALYLIGSIIMRAAGSAWNDLLDRSIDRRVARTRGRPLAAGTVSLVSALIFITLLGLAGLAVLLQFSWFAVAVGAASLILIALYPLAKRVTSHPQMVLGLVFAWGALMSPAHLDGGFSAPALLLYAACVAWIVGYDTIYAMQDIEDDALIGIGSTALAYGPKAHILVAACYGATMLAFLAAAALSDAWPLLPGVLILGVSLLQQYRSLRRAGVPVPPRMALRLFKANASYGLAASAAMLAAAAFAGGG
jgi:4-hydroxybenzoate polyprenyltransferase